jgi:hypothetical protein
MSQMVNTAERIDVIDTNTDENEAMIVSLFSLLPLLLLLNQQDICLLVLAACCCLGS